MGIRQWKLPETTAEQVDALAEQTGLSRMICGILLSRDMTAPVEIETFVDERPRLDDPLLLADMDKAVHRIREALEDGERIAIYGDYDCDGITSTALLTSYLQTVGADVIYYIPNREKEGYGMNRAAVDLLLEQKVDLIVTVDNGISAHEEVAYATELGIDVVITDHHTPRETLPPAVAVVNPHRADCPSRFKELAGVGVAFKLICALEDAHGEELLEYYSDIVTLGTVADVVPLVGENRAIVRHGLGQLQSSENAGIQALIEVSGLKDRTLTSESVAFGIIPRINAAGRMGVADDVVELLLTESAEYAEEVAQQLDQQNQQRKKTEEGILREIGSMLEANPQILKERILLVSGRGWHHGVVGIVAAKLVERYQKPCILFSIEDGVARGSGRSVKGFSLIEAIARCDSRLSRYGGHAMAAGLTLDEAELSAFGRELLDYAGERYPVMPLPQLAADWSLAPGELTVEQMDTLSLLEPFGCANETPLFHMGGLVVEGVYPVSEGRHTRLRLAGGGNSFYAIYFGMNAANFMYQPGEKVEIMAKISVGEYNGKAQLSVKISDLRPAGVPQEDMLDAGEQYACFRREEILPAETAAAITPSREEIGLVYKYLRRAGSFPYGAEGLYFRLMGGGLPYGKLLLALDVLEEMGFLHCGGEGGEMVYTVVPDAPRADLSQSAILAKLKGKAEMLVSEIERV